MKTIAFVACLFAASSAWAQAPAPAGKPLITNGSVQVTSEDFEAFLLRAPEDIRPELRASADRVAKALETIYANRVLADEARKIGLDKDPRVQLRMKQINESYLAQLWMNEYPKTVQTPDFTVRAQEIYKLDKARFTEPARINATHILISLEGRTREMALARANEVVAKARPDENFAALAKNYTDDPNFAKTGGRFEEVAAKDLEKPIADAIFAASPGAVVGPIETKGAFHVVRVESKLASRLRPFEEVKDTLVTLERERFTNLATDRRAGELKNTPQTKVYEDNISALIVNVDRDAVDRAHRPPLAGSQPR
ncbi:MAG: peptidylprolyl isomerase [Betaproteobacteria bacterium]|nr:peptidylprolyl isomerase [Betaproteobacteria bacterium]